MKISCIHYGNNNRKVDIHYGNSERYTQNKKNISDGIITPEKLSDYNFSQKYYNDKKDNNLPVFANAEEFLSVINNKAAADNLYKFIAVRSNQDFIELSSKKELTEEEKVKLELVKVLSQSLSQYRNNSNFEKSERVSFKGVITDEQRSKCRKIIHSASAACAGISAIAGEGAAIGADTPFLRGTQALMFMY